MALMVQEANRNKAWYKSQTGALELENLKLTKENSRLKTFELKYTNELASMQEKQEYLKQRNDQLEELAQKLELGREISGYESLRLGGEFAVAEQVESTGAVAVSLGVRIQVTDRVGAEARAHAAAQKPAAKPAAGAKN